VLAFNGGLAYYPDWGPGLRAAAEAYGPRLWLGVTDYAAFHADRAERAAESAGFAVVHRTGVNPFRSPLRRVATGPVRLPNATNGFVFTARPAGQGFAVARAGRPSVGALVLAAPPVRAGSLEPGQLGLVLEDSGAADSQPLLVLGPPGAAGPALPFWYRPAELTLAEPTGEHALEPHLAAEVWMAGGGSLEDHLAGLLPGLGELGALGVEAQEELLVAATFGPDPDELLRWATATLPAAVAPEAAAGYRGCAGTHVCRLLAATGPPPPARCRMLAQLALACGAAGHRQVAAELVGALQGGIKQGLPVPARDSDRRIAGGAPRRGGCSAQREADTLARRGEFAAAVEGWQAALAGAASPAAAAALYIKIAVGQLHLKRFRAAAAAAGAAAAAHPPCAPRALYRRAQARFKLGNIKGACADLVACLGDGQGGANPGAEKLLAKCRLLLDGD
jgi:hypothetical protein